MLAERIPEIQSALADAGVDGWLFACFQHNDPIGLDLLGLALAGKLLTRRCSEQPGRTAPCSSFPAATWRARYITARCASWRDILPGAERPSLHCRPGTVLVR